MYKLVAFQTILYREIYRFMRIWPQTVLPPAITTSLYFLIFGHLIGSRLGDMGSVRYIDYIVPGIVLMSVITNSYGNVVASFYSSKFQRNIEEMLIAPIPNGLILAGYVMGGVLRGLLTGSIVAGIGSLFTPLHLIHPDIAAGVFLLTATLFSLAGFINAVYANSFDDISIVPNFVLNPLVYLGGVFYSASILPETWRAVALANPMFYMINAFRYGFLGVSDVDVQLAFLVMGGTLIVLLIWAWYLLKKGIGLKS
jgi:ABC-2 type transport system permease protein